MSDFEVHPSGTCAELEKRLAAAQAELEQERKAWREWGAIETENCQHWRERADKLQRDMRGALEEVPPKYRQAMEAKVADLRVRLARVEAETIERCAKVCQAETLRYIDRQKEAEAKGEVAYSLAQVVTELCAARIMELRALSAQPTAAGQDVKTETLGDNVHVGTPTPSAAPDAKPGWAGHRGRINTASTDAALPGLELAEKIAQELGQERSEQARVGESQSVKDHLSGKSAMAFALARRFRAEIAKRTK